MCETSNKTHVHSLFENGLTMLESGQYVHARSCFKKVLEHSPQDIEALANTGLAYFLEVNYFSAAKYWELALKQEHREDIAENVKEAAQLCQAQRLYDEAAAFYALIIEKHPELETSYLWSLRYSLKTKEALRFSESLIRKDPQDLEKRLLDAFLLPQYYDSQADMNFWHQRLYTSFEKLKQDWCANKVVKTESIVVGSPIFDVMSLGQNEKEFLTSVSDFWRIYTGIREGKDERVASLPVSKDSEIRIAWISFSITEHSTMAYFQKLLLYFFEQSDIQNAVFYFGQAHDHVTQRISQDADYFVHLDTNDLHRAKTLIAAWQPHALFYLDIGQEAFLYTLAHYRLAPIQGVSVGIPITTGISTIDYYFSSKWFETSSSQKHYSEALVPLESPPWQVSVPTIKTHKTRKDFGLPESATLFLFPHTLFRFDPTLDAVCAELLSRVENSYLVFIRYKQTHLHTAIKDRISRYCPKVSEQLIDLPWMPQNDFLSLLTLCDVALDSFYLAGGLVSYQCFSAGLPMLHCSTQEVRGRIAGGLYMQCGLSEWIASTPSDYIEKGVKLGSSPLLRNSLSNAITESHDKLFEDNHGLHLLAEFIRSKVRQPI